MTSSEPLVNRWREDELHRFPESALDQFTLPDVARSYLAKVGLPRTRHRFQWSFRFPFDESEPVRLVGSQAGFVAIGGDDQSAVVLREPGGEVFILARTPSATARPQYANRSVEAFVNFIALYEEHLERARAANYGRQPTRESAERMMSAMGRVDESALAKRTDFWRTFLAG